MQRFNTSVQFDIDVEFLSDECQPTNDTDRTIILVSALSNIIRIEKDWQNSDASDVDLGKILFCYL